MQLLLRESLAVFSQLHDEIKNVISESKTTAPRYSRFASGQMHYYGERCQSLTLLLQDWKLWDSEILMRAATECATRFIFVSSAEPAERATRIDEYEIHLNEIDDLQRSEKAKPVVDAAMDSDTAMLLGRLGLEQVTSQLKHVTTKLDPILRPETIFDPTDPNTSGRVVALTLVAQTKHPLARIPEFYGAGVYAIYYRGDFPPYAPLKGVSSGCKLIHSSD